MDYWIYDAPEDSDYFKEKQKKAQEEQEKREKRFAFIAVISAIVFVVGSFGGLVALDRKALKKYNKRNASYITEAVVGTPFYEWCMNAVNIDTIVCISEGKAFLYEIDEGRDEFLENLKIGVYKVIDNNGEDKYIPVSMALSFPTHKEAEEYAKQVVGEENIVCTNYYKHNSVNTRKLVP